MTLAEALSLRADLQKRISQLKPRLKNSSKVLEGDEPAENVEDLFAEQNELLSQLETLIYRINETNMRTVHNGENLTRMMARKDILSMRVATMRELLKFVSENETRYGRSELKYIRMVDVAKLRKEMDDYACQLRKLDIEIQRLNWLTDL